MSDLAEKVQRHETAIRELEGWRAEADRDILELQKTDERILALLAKSSTKEDVAALSLQVERSINGILKEALSAVPHKYAVIVAIVLGVITAFGFVAGLVVRLHGA